MRDFRSELSEFRFWDKETEAFVEENGLPIVDRALQNREEIIALCEWIEEQGITSYLEIGIWTGKLLSALHSLFNFETLAACDIGYSKEFDLEINLPPETLYFEGNSRSPIYQNWRAKLGQIDLTFIDTDHSYEGVKRDFNINANGQQRFIALHGIAGSERTGDGVKRIWEELKGDKIEIIRPHKEIDSAESTGGIGIWKAPS